MNLSTSLRGVPSTVEMSPSQPKNENLPNYVLCCPGISQLKKSEKNDRYMDLAGELKKYGI